MSKKKLLLVDGSNLLFRSYFAFQRSGLTTSDGRPSSAVFGFVRLLIDAITKEMPEEVFVAWDPKGGTFRDKEFEYYKANRPDEMPEDLLVQLPEVFRVIDYFGIKQKFMEGFEADDLIGTLAVKAQKKNWKVLVYSGDRDLFQLVNEDINCLYPSRKGGLELYGEKEVVVKMGVTPSQIIDYKGLAGDTSDNIKGVPGVGEKTAQKLLAEYGTFDGVFENKDKITPAGLQKKIIENEQLARDSYYLATVKTDVDIDLDLDTLHPFDVDEKNLNEFITEYGLKSLQKTLPLLLQKYGQKVEIKPPEIKLQVPKKSKKLWNGEINELIGVSRVGIGFGDDTWLGFVKAGVEYYGKIVDLEKFCSEYHGEVVVYDVKTLKKQYKYLPDTVIDTMLGIYIWNSSVKNNVIDLLDEIGYADENKIEYSGLQMLWVADYLTSEMDKSRQDLWIKLETQVALVLSDMEQNGVYIDKKKLSELNETLEKKKLEYTKLIQSQLGREDFNINSTQQLAAVLDEAGFKLGKKNKNGSFSTKADILEKLAETDETGLINNILEYRTITKLHSSFTDTFLQALDGESRLHTEYGQTVVATGRLSSKNPNLQNIPIRHDEYGPLIRSCFAAQEDRVVVAADYSQIELRCLAHVSKDEILIDAFKKDQDIHSRTAAEVFGLDIEKVDKNMRRLGKTLNFALVYQQGAFATARQLGITTAEAKEFTEKYFNKFPKVKPLIEKTLENAREIGYVETIWKRRRYFNNLQSGNALLRSGEERAAFNAVLQGSGADIVKFAMIRIQRKLRELKIDALMVMQVHDELVFEVGKKDVDKLVEMIQGEMQLGQPLLVPLKIDIGVGENWSECK
jgi:DNA polymerase I